MPNESEFAAILNPLISIPLNVILYTPQTISVLQLICIITVKLISFQQVKCNCKHTEVLML